MKIKISSENKRFTVFLPTSLAFSRLGLHFAKKNGELNTLLSDIKGKDLKHIRNEIKRIKRLRPEWKLVEIKSTDGSGVEIKL